ncbi:sulfatase family protein [Winogradskyella forsetii]|uniref:sulfatase family protein n=1 Tax=Winogradskyella forsetii TaxID=2686077 RepID=UPI0015B9967D|nr:sulfatase [Winogradskyella forsetii]
MTIISNIHFLGILTILMSGCQSGQKQKVIEKPNILLVVADDATVRHMGAYGSKFIKTPAFDRVAKNGVLFNKAYTPNAKCAPSRASMLTGRNSWQLEAGGNHMSYFPSKFKTFPEVLDENGYHVGYTGKGWLPGVAFNEDGTKRDLLIKNYSNIELDAPTTEISNNDYAANFNAFLNENESDKPFFFWFGSWEPHRQYEYESGLRSGKKLSEIDEVFKFWPDTEEVRKDILDYALELEYFDTQLGKLIKQLELNNELDNTIIIVTSDNGMPFPRIKGQEYELSNHLPLAIMWPKGIKHKDRKIEDFVNFTDLAPTILEFVGISNEDSGMAPIQGKSLAKILTGNKSGIVDSSNDHILIGKERHDIGRPNNEGYPIRGIFKGDYLYLKNFKTDRWPGGNPETGYLNCDGGPTKTAVLDSYGTDNHQYWQMSFGKRVEEELYNIKLDPLCMSNLAYDENYKIKKEELFTQMTTELIEQNDPRIVGEGDIFDNYKIFPKKFMDYHQRYMNGEEMPELHWVKYSDFRQEQNSDLKK